jgi:DNA polymerase III epsilon subunit-like protein
VKVFFLDTETAVSTPEDSLLEIGIKEYQKPGKSYNMKPHRPIRSAGTACHGITNKMAESWPTPREALEAFTKDYAGIADPGSVVLGWNIGFDTDILDKESKFQGVKLPQFKAVDLMRAAKRSVPLSESGKMTLDAVYCYFAGDDEKLLKEFFEKRSTHGALIDCELTEQLYDWLLAKSGREPEKFILDLNKPELLTEFPIGKYKGVQFREALADFSYIKWLCGQAWIHEPNNVDLKFTLEHHGKRCDIKF